MDRVTRLASQKAVVVFSKSSCGMSHAVTRLLRELGVDARVVELDEEPAGADMENALAGMLLAGTAAAGGRGRGVVVPTVFIGGRLVGSTDRVMSLHVAGGLVPLLRDAGALWV
uniref:Glutaredoxin domain-containing protein n=1 Tax=Oryza meridionalis TaxID=40149 RepID=A0A0E0DM34_9ORYZ